MTMSSNLNIVFFFYNNFVKLWAHIGTLLDVIPSRPFEVSDNSTATCNQEKTTGNKGEIHSITNNIGAEEMNVFSSFFTWKGFPAYDVRVVYAGATESEQWGSFVILRYSEYEDYCELVTSKLFEESVRDAAIEMDWHGYLVQPL